MLIRRCRIGCPTSNSGNCVLVHLSSPYVSGARIRLPAGKSASATTTRVQLGRIVSRSKICRAPLNLRESMPAFFPGQNWQRERAGQAGAPFLKRGLSGDRSVNRHGVRCNRKNMLLSTIREEYMATLNDMKSTGVDAVKDMSDRARHGVRTA